MAEKGRNSLTKKWILAVSVDLRVNRINAL